MPRAGIEAEVLAAAATEGAALLAAAVRASDSAAFAHFERQVS